MENDLDKILRTVERIAFSVIGLAAAMFLLIIVSSLDPGSYGRTLLDGLSVYMVIGAIILFLWVAYNVFHSTRYRENSKK